MAMTTSSNPNILHNSYRLIALAEAVAVLAALTACGGGGGTGNENAAMVGSVNDSAQPSSNSPTSIPVVTEGGTPSLPSNVPTSTSTQATFSPSDDDLINPERGYYVSVDDSFMTESGLSSVSAFWSSRLFWYRIALDPYTGGPLPQSFLDALNARFDAGRRAGVKFIVQASYNSDSSGTDAPIGIVLQHIAQLKPVFAMNADVIPFVKAGFIGAWGEWWGSQSGLDSVANKLSIKNALLAATPATTIVQFRYPSDIFAWYPNPAAAAAARVGYHNDCYMANNTDEGTFTGLSDPLRGYVNEMSINSAFGGETCEGVSNFSQARRGCDQALSEGAAGHLTWLNMSYSAVFVADWKAGGCYAQIGRKMGYRLQLDKLSHAASAVAGNVVDVAVDLSNVGWARMFSHRPLQITLRNKSSGATIRGSAGDLSTLAAGATSQITVGVSIPAGSAAGDYAVEVGVPDIWSTTASDSRYAVRFGNANSGAQAWNAGTGRFNTGSTLTIK